jgi:hypothetical protein
MQDGVRGSATVVDNRMTSHRREDGRDAMTFQAVVVLDHQDDAQPVMLPDTAYQSYVVGSKLDVVYDPANPSRVETVSGPGGAGFAVGAVMLVFFGVMLLAVVGFAVFALTMVPSGFAGE